MNTSTNFISKSDNDKLVFVSDLPKETTNEDLDLFFKDYSIVHCKLYSGRANACAYVSLASAEKAQSAIKELNGKDFTAKYSESKSSRPIRVCKYIPKNEMEKFKDTTKSLLVKNLDKNLSAREFYLLFSKFGEIKSSKLEVDDQGISKGYGYIFYETSDSAEQAKKEMNGSVVNSKVIEVVNLIPSKSKVSNSVFVQNFPTTFNELDLKLLFEKYGEVTSAIVSRDHEGKSRGFGFISFLRPETADLVVKKFRQNSFTFPGLNPLHVAPAVKNMIHEKDNSKGKLDLQECTLLCWLIHPDPSIENEIELEREIRLFIKIILLSEYTPRDIRVNFHNKSAVILMKNKKDVHDFLKNYTDFTTNNFPKFAFSMQMPNIIPQMMQKPQTSLIDQMNNLSLNPQPIGQYPLPQRIVNQMQPITLNKPHAVPYQSYPIQHKVPLTINNPEQLRYYNQPFTQNGMGQQPMFSQSTDNDRNDQEREDLADEIADQIYEIIEKIYPDEASKITGMIREMGLQKMNRLLSRREHLNQVIEQAHEMLIGLNKQ